MDTPSSSNSLHGDSSFKDFKFCGLREDMEDGEFILLNEDKLNEVVVGSKAPLVHYLLNFSTNEVKPRFLKAFPLHYFDKKEILVISNTQRLNFDTLNVRGFLYPSIVFSSHSITPYIISFQSSIKSRDLVKPFKQSIISLWVKCSVHSMCLKPPILYWLDDESIVKVSSEEELIEESEQQDLL